MSTALERPRHMIKFRGQNLASAAGESLETPLNFSLVGRERRTTHSRARPPRWTLMRLIQFRGVKNKLGNPLGGMLGEQHHLLWGHSCRPILKTHAPRPSVIPHSTHSSIREVFEYRHRANMQLIRQSQPDSGFQVKHLETFQVFSHLFGRGSTLWT